ncbi:predicted protein [Lichtheimia corymbifera JMRC:FSU:9682]|uniref:MSP domain-containing protein n=1 Tax=Lichtheimia corymbifera JMRC:FSU:9682 TaxID=1263082 RepID=A0A068RKJ5_9FUNG|nr:predicted protein [Lichtheimia corymbifera JMRC:FSU:9682]
MSLVVKPKNYICFERPLTRPDLQQHFVIKNPDDRRAVAFKILTNASSRYNVRPPFGIVDKQSEVRVKVTMVPFEEEPHHCTDAFLVRSAGITEDEQKDLPFKELWAVVSHNDIHDYQLKCVYLAHGVHSEDASEFENNEEEMSISEDDEGFPLPMTTEIPRPYHEEIPTLHNKLSELSQTMMAHQQEIINMRLQLLYMRQQKDFQRGIRALAVVVLCILIGYGSRSLL